MMYMCREWGCHRLVEKGFCKKHIVGGTARAAQAHEDFLKRMSRQKLRQPPADRGVNWTYISQQFRQSNPQCITCGGVGTVVDHIVPLRLGGGNETINLQTMCRPCHARKTQSEHNGMRWRAEK